MAKALRRNGRDQRFDTRQRLLARVRAELAAGARPREPVLAAQVQALVRDPWLRR